MKRLPLLIVFSIFLNDQISSQTITEEIYDPGFNRYGYCGFYWDIDLTTPQPQRATNIYINTFVRNAFKDYSNLPYTSVRFKMWRSSGE